MFFFNAILAFFKVLERDIFHQNMIKGLQKELAMIKGKIMN